MVYLQRVWAQQLYVHPANVSGNLRSVPLALVSTRVGETVVSSRKTEDGGLLLPLGRGGMSI